MTVAIADKRGNELRESISKTMGYWSPDGFDAYPEKTEKIVQLIQAREQEAERRGATRMSVGLTKWAQKHYPAFAADMVKAMQQLTQPQEGKKV